MNRITIKQAAEIFFEGNVSKELLYKEVKAKNLPHVKLSSGKILLDTGALERWWESKLLRSVQKDSTDENYQIGTEKDRHYGSLRRIPE